MENEKNLPENGNNINVMLQGSKGEPGDSGAKGDSGVKGDTGAKGERGDRGIFPLSTVAGYLVLAAAAIIGVWFIGHDASEDLKDNINSTVSALCIQDRPNIIKENALRDAQIEIAEDAKIVNLAEGDGTRAALNDRTITALEAAKRHVPTVAECNQDTIP